jgi:hypothetical protein
MNTRIALARTSVCLLLAAASVHAHARQAAADAQASVPPTRYQSTLDQRPGSAPAASPDASWVASNETVAATDSMALTMKPMNAQAADPHAGHAMPPAAPADAHAGHAQHDHAAMQGMGMGMNMDKKDGPAMCSPASGAGAAGKGMQCMSGDEAGNKAGGKAGEGKMACCQSCCKDKMKKDKETP